MLVAYTSKMLYMRFVSYFTSRNALREMLTLSRVDQRVTVKIIDFEVFFSYVFNENLVFFVQKVLRKTTSKKTTCFPSILSPKLVPEQPILGPNGPLGRLLGGSWSLLGASWSLLGASWALLERSWSAFGRSWALLERSWTLLGTDFGHHRPILS